MSVIAAPDTPRFTRVRDPADLRRLLIFLAVSLVGLFAAVGAQQTTAGAEEDLVALIGNLPAFLLQIVLLGAQVLYLLFFLTIPVVLFFTRRRRLLGLYALAFVAASVLTTVIAALLPETDPVPLADGTTDALSGGWPLSTSVGTAVAALVVLSPTLSRPWRRFGWGFVAVLAVLRVVTAGQVVFDIVLAIGIGGVVGAATLLIFGRQISVPTWPAVAAALAGIGVAADTFTDSGRSDSGALVFRASGGPGPAVHCKVLTSQQYQADSILRTYRRVRVRGLGEDVAYSSVRRAAAVESMLAMTARAAGARAPEVLGVAPLGEDEMLIAQRALDGSTLDAVEPDRITDDVLRQAWASLERMRGARVAHRDLQLASWMLDDEDQLWVIDFSFGEPAASDGALSTDIAELLAATYAVVGAERAVAAAVDVLGPETLATGISHLVPAALTRPTRSAVKSQEGGLEPLVTQTCEACGVEEPEFAAIERVKPRTLVVAGMLAVAIYVLLPQLTDLPRMIDAIREADPLLIGAAAAASLATYIGVAMALSGSIPAPVRFGYALLTSVASSFVGAVAPPGIATAGVNVRFAQKQGMPPPVAVSAAAAKEVAVAGVHIVLLLLIAVFAGSSDVLQEELDKLPSAETIAIIVAVAICVIAGAAAVPRVRRIVRTTVLPAVQHSLSSLRDLAADPLRMLVLFSGALILQLGYIGALYFSVQALGGEIPLVAIALIYLTVGSAATIAPTPGGIGAVEAVLIAALTGVGMAAAPALAAVFLYRLVTFWVPIPIGALAMRALVSRDLL